MVYGLLIIWCDGGLVEDNHQEWKILGIKSERNKLRQATMSSKSESKREDSSQYIVSRFKHIC